MRRFNSSKIFYMEIYSRVKNKIKQVLITSINNIIANAINCTPYTHNFSGNEKIETSEAEKERGNCDARNYLIFVIN